MTQKGISPKRILLVEPYDDARHVLSILLEHVGHHVKAARNVEEALTSVSIEPPDVVLTEICALEMSGQDFCHALRKLPDMACARIVAMTGYCKPSDMAELMRAGVNTVLLKPSTLDEITQAIT